jgi:uncharacterized protein
VPDGSPGTGLARYPATPLGPAGLPDRVHARLANTTEGVPPVPPTRRSPLRRYLEVRGAIRHVRHPEIVARIRTEDGVALRGSYLAVPTGSGTRVRPSTDGVAVLLAPGFAANRYKPSYARLAEALARRLPVLTLDLRGHGESEGRCTLGDREALDVEAAARWLHRIGHGRVVAVGASMGATAVLHAASRGLDLEAVATVSAPAAFRAEPEGRVLTQLDAVWRSPVRRRALRMGLGISLDGPRAWREPPHPEQMVQSIQSPMLIVHGDDDAYFPPEDADRLARGAAGAVVVWHEPTGFGHAEDGFTPAFVARLADAVAEVVVEGRFPERAASTSRLPRTR